MKMLTANQVEIFMEDGKLFAAVVGISPTVKLFMSGNVGDLIDAQAISATKTICMFRRKRFIRTAHCCILERTGDVLSMGAVMKVQNVPDGNVIDTKANVVTGNTITMLPGKIPTKRRENP